MCSSDNSTNFYDRNVLSYHKSDKQIKAPFANMKIGGLSHIKEIVFELIKKDPNFFARIHKDSLTIGIMDGIINLYMMYEGPAERESVNTFESKVNEITSLLLSNGYFTNGDKFLNSKLIIRSKDPETNNPCMQFFFRTGTKRDNNDYDKN